MVSAHPLVRSRAVVVAARVVAVAVLPRAELAAEVVALEGAAVAAQAVVAGCRANSRSYCRLPSQRASA